ncbi:MAG TPA: hypothetical protein VNZ64_01260 [Candidatus Acidoferrum sp.]|jgi:hypothetical protein|nr:hypothetical protein [Candidatus Acidoferrum sp.]
MKISRQFQTSGSAGARAGRAEHGMAIIVVLVLLSIILLYLTASARTLHLLGRDLKLIEQQQIHRLVSPSHGTNGLTATNRLTSFNGTNAHGPDISH